MTKKIGKVVRVGRVLVDGPPCSPSLLSLPLQNSLLTGIRICAIMGIAHIGRWRN